MEDDNLLIKKYLEGDQYSLKKIIDKYTPSIYNFASRLAGNSSAPDITQEVFIKVWKNLKNFNLDKSQFKTWLFTIARNTTIDYLRKKKSVVFSSLDTEDDVFEDSIEDTSDLPDELLQKLQDNEKLKKILNELREDYREVLTLYYQEDMTFKEIGDVLGKPLNTVKNYHFRAIKKLKELCTNL